jgi:hypothetical protein
MSRWLSSGNFPDSPSQFPINPKCGHDGDRGPRCRRYHATLSPRASMKSGRSAATFRTTSSRIAIGKSSSANEPVWESVVSAAVKPVSPRRWVVNCPATKPWLVSPAVEAAGTAWDPLV